MNYFFITGKLTILQQIKLMVKILSACIFFLILISSCNSSKKNSKTEDANNTVKAKTISNSSSTKAKVFTKPLKIDRKEFVNYAKTFIGTPYKYGSSTPKNGLDCSGFIMVVFGHFNVKTPRVSKDFTNEGVDIELKNAMVGDIILFTGSDNNTGIVGHIGIITIAGNVPTFISSTSGKNIGVAESKLSGYWKTHFVKVIRLLE
jgi:cell wall-associated NlpC family hydrolase